MLPIIDRVTAGSEQRIRDLIGIRPCFGWQYHDLDPDMRPLETTCPRDGTDRDERRMCEVRPLCAEAWDDASRVKQTVERPVHDELVRPKYGTGRTLRPRRAYCVAKRQSDEVLHALNLKLGLPPVLYDRDWFIRSKSAAKWARENLGPMFAVAPRSYHSYIGHIPTAPLDYFLLARAWTGTAHVLRVDLMPELAGAVMASPSLKGALEPIPPTRNAQARFPGARFRVLLYDRPAALVLGGLMLAQFGLSFGELAAWGARWRGEVK